MKKLLSIIREQNNTVLPLLFFTMFFVGNAVLGYFSLRQITDDDAMVSLSRHNINLINQLHMDVLRAETGQRGYLLTDLDSYAEPYIEAASAIDQKILDLASTTLVDSQRELFFRLEATVRAKMAEMDEAVEFIRSNRDSAAIQTLLTHRGRDLMQEISATANEMEAFERNMLELRLAKADESRTTSFYLILTANLVGLVMVFVSMRLVHISRQKEQVMLASLQDAKNNLEKKVEERTSTLLHFSHELKRSNRELQDFAFVASHDLQEPLRKIRAFGDRLEQNYGSLLGTQGADYIQRMQVAAERMATLIDDLLSFSRITSKAKPFLPVNLQEVVEEVLDDFDVAIENSKAIITISSLPVLDADRFQMKQLFQNLLSNALKFRHADSAPRISVTLADNHKKSGKNDMVCIRVQDNGIGFSENFKDRIFMPFQRLHGKHEYAGTGIGLAICRRIVERHNGTINASSTPGSGSCFEICLPLHNTAVIFEENV